MANINCSACEDLRSTAPSLVVNGIGESECTSLKNNTGLNPSSGHNDCTDLDNLNDCLVGNMEQEVEMYEVCDWKTFMKKFIPNVWTVFKGIICTLCGLWSNISKLWCTVNFLFGSVSFRITEDNFIAGADTTLDPSSISATELSLVVRGNNYRVHGSVGFKDDSAHTFAGNNVGWSYLGLTNNGNSKGSAADGYAINTTDGNWRIALLKIKKSDYPQIAGWYDTTGAFTNAGCGQVHVRIVNGDAEQSGVKSSPYYPSQWGWDTGTDNIATAGYWFIIVELMNVITWGKSHSDGYYNVTFDALGLVRLNENEIDC